MFNQVQKVWNRAVILLFYKITHTNFVQPI